MVLASSAVSSLGTKAWCSQVILSWVSLVKREDGMMVRLRPLVCESTVLRMPPGVSTPPMPGPLLAGE